VLCSRLLFGYIITGNADRRTRFIPICAASVSGGMDFSMRVLRNYNEEWVKKYLDRHISSYDVCNCDECRLDIMAIALNKLPPQYVVTDEGAIFASLSEMSHQRMVDLATVVTEAVMAVNSRPHHQ
jgi:competence protein ComFB